MNNSGSKKDKNELNAHSIYTDMKNKKGIEDEEFINK